MRKNRSASGHREALALSTVGLRLISFAVFCILTFAGCGGPKHPPPHPPPPADRDTRFDGVAPSFAGGQVCLSSTSWCNDVGDDGSFKLDADVDGNVELVFQGEDFAARLLVDEVPAGAAVHFGSINCSLDSDLCSASALSIVASDGVQDSADETTP